MLLAQSDHGYEGRNADHRAHLRHGTPSLAKARPSKVAGLMSLPEMPFTQLHQIGLRIISRNLALDLGYGLIFYISL